MGQRMDKRGFWPDGKPRKRAPRGAFGRLLSMPVWTKVGRRKSRSTRTLEYTYISFVLLSTHPPHTARARAYTRPPWPKGQKCQKVRRAQIRCPIGSRPRDVAIAAAASNRTRQAAGPTGSRSRARASASAVGIRHFARARSGLLASPSRPATGGSLSTLVRGVRRACGTARGRKPTCDKVTSQRPRVTRHVGPRSPAARRDGNDPAFAHDVPRGPTVALGGNLEKRTTELMDRYFRGLGQAGGRRTPRARNHSFFPVTGGSVKRGSTDEGHTYRPVD